MLKIDKKITGYKVLTGIEDQVTTKPLVMEVDIISAKQQLKRPLRLDNEWRLKPPYANHALYVRLNAIEYEGKKYPYEIFFNTKDVKDIKWLNALTVTISTAFRTAIETGTSLQPLIDNFKESCDTESPYLSKVTEKPKFVNGLVAELGLVIEVFNKECNAWNYSESSHERPATEEEKQAIVTDLPYIEPEVEGYPPNATICKACGTKAVVILDGCATCLDCGDAKCG